MSTLTALKPSKFTHPFRSLFLITTILLVTSCSAQARPDYNHHGDVTVSYSGYYDYRYDYDDDYRRESHYYTPKYKKPHRVYYQTNTHRVQPYNYNVDVATHVAGAVLGGIISHSFKQKKRHKKKRHNKVSYVNNAIGRCNPKLSNCYKN